MSGDPLGPVSTGVAAVDTAVVWALVVVTVAGGFALLWRILRSIGRATHTLDNFAEDWHGEAARPGVPARPGVMERLGNIEGRLSGVERRLEGPPGSSPGGSARDGRAMRVVT